MQRTTTMSAPLTRTRLADGLVRRPARHSPPGLFLLSGRPLRAHGLSFATAAIGTRTVPLRAPLSLSRVLRRKDLPPMTKMDVANMLGSTTHTFEGTTPLELNLFEDPTGGLAAGPAEEMTSAELETHVRLLVPAYTPDLYRLLYTPFVDVMFVIVSEGLVPDHAPPSASEAEVRAGRAPVGARTDVTEGEEEPEDDDESRGETRYTERHRVTSSVDENVVSLANHRPEQIMVRWFTDGQATLKNPNFTRDAMGEERWQRFCRALEVYCEPMASVEPLTRTVRKYGLREDLFIPLMRQTALNLVERETRKATIASLPGFILGMANGRAPASLGLPIEREPCVQCVAEIFLSTGQETGNTDLAYLGLQLVRANDMAVPYRFQKQLTNVFAASARIQTDWQFRATGQLVETYRRWLDYFRKVAADNMHALQQQQRKIAASASATEGHSKTVALAASGSRDADDGVSAFDEDEPARDYFASHRRDDVARSVALQANIEAAIRQRAPHLAPWLQRGARRRHTTPPPLTHQAPQRTMLSASADNAADGNDGDMWGQSVRGAEAAEEPLEAAEYVEKTNDRKKRNVTEARRSAKASSTKSKAQQPQKKKHSPSSSSASKKRETKGVKAGHKAFTLSF